MIVTVQYPVKAGNKFDLDYYLAKHMKLVVDSWSAEGLKRAEVLKAIGTPAGGDVPFQVSALLHFESMQAFQAAAAKNGGPIFADIPNFTDVQPVIQFNEQVM